MHLIVTGAGGWVGRNALDWADGVEVVPVASRARLLETPDGPVPALAVSDLPGLTRAPSTLIIHAGFPTQDRVDAMGEEAYSRSVGDLRATMLEVIERQRPVDLIYFSSGAATSVERGVNVAHRTRIYGQAKLDDEAAFTDAIASTGGRSCIVRAFALSGPYMTKPETYALGNMVLQALSSGTIEVQATRPVRRSYMAITDVLHIARNVVGGLPAGGSVMFETAGEVVEVGDLAARVLAVLGGDPAAVMRPALDPGVPPDDYLGDPRPLERLASAAGVVPAGLDAQIAVTAAWLREGMPS